MSPCTVNGRTAAAAFRYEEACKMHAQHNFCTWDQAWHFHQIKQNNANGPFVYYQPTPPRRHLRTWLALQTARQASRNACQLLALGICMSVQIPLQDPWWWYMTCLAWSISCCPGWMLVRTSLKSGQVWFSTVGATHGGWVFTSMLLFNCRNNGRFPFQLIILLVSRSHSARTGRHLIIGLSCTVHGCASKKRRHLT